MATSFVGRERELAAIDAARDDGVVCVVVEDAPGIGKSSLLRQAAGAAGVVVTAEESEALVDHAVADQLLRALGDRAPGVLAADAETARRPAAAAGGGQTEAVEARVRRQRGTRCSVRKPVAAKTVAAKRGRVAVVVLSGRQTRRVAPGV